MKVELFRAWNVSVDRNSHMGLHDISFGWHRGETLGILTLERSGRQLLADLIDGEAVPQKGAVFFRGRQIASGGHGDLLLERIAHSGRTVDGMTVWENMMLLRKGKHHHGVFSERFLRYQARDELCRFCPDLDIDMDAALLDEGDRSILSVLRACAGGAEAIMVEGLP